MSTTPYDIADELAALNRVRLIQELEPAFYERHWQRVAYVTTMASSLANTFAELRLMLGVCAQSALDDAARGIRDTLAAIELDDEARARFFRELDLGLRSAL